MSLVRFGVGLDEVILKTLEYYVVENNLPNRSQAIRYLVEKHLVDKKWQCNNIVTGAVALLYDHHKSDVTTNSNDIQHEYFDFILSLQHFIYRTIIVLKLLQLNVAQTD